MNHERPKHTVTSDDYVFDSGRMSEGDSSMFPFNKAGAFLYSCRFHGDNGGTDMSGIIITQQTRIR